MNRIYELREGVRISQRELADALGWQQARLSQYERSVRTPGLAESRAITHALQSFGVICQLDDVFPPSGDETKGRRVKRAA